MSMSQKVREFLTRNKVAYEVIDHPETFTAQETAQAEHISGKYVAKAVIVKVDKKFVMTVLPAPNHVSLPKLKQILGAKDAKLADEREFQGLFSGCELGAIPPFGELFGIPAYVDESLAENGWVVFNAGNHRESVKVSSKDFGRLAKSELVAFSI